MSRSDVIDLMGVACELCIHVCKMKYKHGYQFLDSQDTDPQN